MSRRADVILAVAEIIRAYPRVALKAPERSSAIVVPVLSNSAHLIDDIVEMTRGLEFVAGVELSTWLDSADPDRAGVSIRVTCHPYSQTEGAA